MGTRILVVDDEETICNLLDRVLQRDGYSVLKTTRGQDALPILLKEKPDLMILDLNLPDLSGEQIYESVRQDPRAKDIPILILTGRPIDGLPAKCLNGGADAFLYKPFEASELLALVRSLLRRATVYLEKDKTIASGDLAIQLAERTVVLKGVPIQHLSPKEFDVLKELVLHSPRVVKKADLAEKIWGVSLDRLHPRTMDVHIRRIRQKIGVKGSICLRTVSAIGYQWLAKN